MAIYHPIVAYPGIEDLNLLIEKALGEKIEAAQKIAESTFGIVYEVRLREYAGTVTVKWQKYRGRGATEMRQLQELGKYSCARVATVLHYHTATKELPFEALILDYIPGLPGTQVVPGDDEQANALANNIIQILLCWHSVNNPDGYGKLDGPYYPRWLDYYGQRIEVYHAHIHNEDCEIHPIVIEAADKSFNRIEEILGYIEGEAVLIHSDFWLGNIIVDPETSLVKGVIDPLDAEWAEREIDLILLNWPWGERDYLLNLYLQKVNLRPGFPLRYAFYLFWYAIQNLVRLGWYDEVRTPQLAEKLEEEMRTYL